MALKERSSSKSKSASKGKVIARKRTMTARSAATGEIRELSKRERLEARVSTPQKKLFNKAAAMQGRSLSDFMVSTLDKEARKIVHDFEALEFSLKEKEAFVAALDNPPAPSDALIRAFERLAHMESNV